MHYIDALWKRRQRSSRRAVDQDASRVGKVLVHVEDVSDGTQNRDDDDDVAKSGIQGTMLSEKSRAHTVRVDAVTNTVRRTCADDRAALLKPIALRLFEVLCTLPRRLLREVLLDIAQEVERSENERWWCGIVEMLTSGDDVVVVDGRNDAIRATARRVRNVIKQARTLEETVSRASMRALCFHLGHVPKVQLGAALSSIDRRLADDDDRNTDSCGTVLLRVVVTCPSTTREGAEDEDDDVVVDDGYISLAANAAQLILHALLAVVSHRTSDVENGGRAMLDMLLRWLDGDKDGDGTTAMTAISVRVVASFASSIESRDECLPLIFSRLKSDSTATRRNALRVVVEICRRCCVSTIDDDARDLRERLTEALLERLDDEELQLRTEAGRVLAFQDPAFVVPRLCRCIAEAKKSDARARSAAVAALSRLLADRNADVERALTALLDTMRHGWGGRSPDVAMNSEWHKHALRSVASWASKFDTFEREETARKISDVVILKALASPSDATVFAFIRALHPLFETERTRSAVLLLLDRMRAQSTLDDVRGGSDDEMLRCLLFARLNAVLILKSLPQAVFDDVKISAPALCVRLLERANSNAEFDDVRRQAAEVLSRIAPQVLLSQIVDGMRRFSKSYVENGDVSAIRACRALVFAFCNCAIMRVVGTGSTLSTSPKWWRPHIDTIFDALVALLKLSLQSIRTDETDAEDRYKLQRGCIDAIASAILADEVLTERRRRNDGDTVVSRCLALAADTSSSAAIRVCATNAIMTVHKIMQSQSLDRAHFPSIARDVLRSVLVSRSSKNQSKKDDDATLRAASLRLLFVMCYHCKDAATEHADRVFARSLSAVRDPAPASTVRIEGLKLLGALMGSVEGLFRPEVLPIGSFAQATATLQGISNMDADPQARKLASDILRLLSV
eukprot:g3477.t1